MKPRSLFSFIFATTFFLAAPTAIYDLSLTNNQGVVEAATNNATTKVTQCALDAIGRDGWPRRINSPVEMPWGVSREGIFGATEAAQITGNASDQSQVFDMCQMSIWRHMSRVTRIVILILLGMAIWSVVIMAERYITFSAATNQSREFAPKVASSLMRQEIDEAIKLSDKYKESHLAIVVSAGLREFRAHQLSGDISGAVVDASKRALQRATAIKIAEFRRGLSVLATIGSIALFVGLFGTLFGIIDVLEYMTDSAWGGISAAAGGIAEALVTTAAGLAVAVPTVWLFKYFTTKVEKFAVEMDISSAELIDFFLKQPVKK